jgi:hypothetical protein
MIFLPTTQQAKTAICDTRFSKVNTPPRENNFSGESGFFTEEGDAEVTGGSWRVAMPVATPVFSRIVPPYHWWLIRGGW